MAVAYSFLTLTLCLLTGGGNDLLDYLPTEAYWNAKKVQVSVEAMAAELANKPGEDVTALIAELGSPDAATRDAAAVKIREKGGISALPALAEAAESPDAEVRRRARGLLHQIGGDRIVRGVRRLMAIRTLGEIGKPEGLTALKPLLESKELFEAEYTRAAIDAIEGRKPADRAAAAAGVADDVWMLPKQCRTVGQLVPRRGAPVGYAEFLASLKANDDDSRTADAETVTQWVLSLAERYGNVRIDAVTFGLQGNPFGFNATPENPSSVVVIVRGRYHADWCRMLAKADRIAARETNGVEAFDLDGTSAVLMPSDDVLVYMAGRTTDELPIDEMTTVVKAGKGSLAADEEMRKLVASVGERQVLWAAAAVTQSQRELPVAGAFDTITLLGTREGKTLRLKMNARGRDPAAVAKAVQDVDKHAKASAEFLSGIHGFTAITLATELLQSVKVEASGTGATLTAQIETTPAAVLSVPGLFDDGPEEAPADQPAHPRLKRNEK